MALVLSTHDNLFVEHGRRFPVNVPFMLHVHNPAQQPKSWDLWPSGNSKDVFTVNAEHLEKMGLKKTTKSSKEAEIVWITQPGVHFYTLQKGFKTLRESDEEIPLNTPFVVTSIYDEKTGKFLHYSVVLRDDGAKDFRFFKLTEKDIERLEKDDGLKVDYNGQTITFSF